MGKISNTYVIVLTQNGVSSLKLNKEKIIGLTESKSNIEYIPLKQTLRSGYSDYKRRVPDNSKIRKVVDWHPLKSIEDIILDTATYQKKLHNKPS